MRGPQETKTVSDSMDDVLLGSKKQYGPFNRYRVPRNPGTQLYVCRIFHHQVAIQLTIDMLE